MNNEGGSEAARIQQLNAQIQRLEQQKALLQQRAQQHQPVQQFRQVQPQLRPLRTTQPHPHPNFIIIRPQQTSSATAGAPTLTTVQPIRRFSPDTGLFLALSGYCKVAQLCF